MTRAPICPIAVYEPLAGLAAGRGSNGPFAGPPIPYGLVLHCNAAHSGDLHDFEENNLDNGPTSHYQLKADGTLYQYIPLNMTSWCQTDGNNTYHSIETSGVATEELTDAQMATLAKLLAWHHTEWDMPLQLADVPGQRGFGWHGMGSTPAMEAQGIDWGHSVCPGIRKDQRQTLLDMAANGDDDIVDQATIDAIGASAARQVLAGEITSTHYKAPDGKTALKLSLAQAADTAAFYAQTGSRAAFAAVMAELAKIEAAEQPGSPVGSLTLAQVTAAFDAEIAKVHLSASVA